MARARWAKPRQETKEQLLLEAGYKNVNDAPEHLRVLAEIAASGRSGGVVALRDFLRLTDRYIEDKGETPIKLEYGDVCPVCKRKYYPENLILGADIVERLLNYHELESESESA
jgi:hypothetical protein